MALFDVQVDIKVVGMNPPYVEKIDVVPGDVDGGKDGDGNAKEGDSEKGKADVGEDTAEDIATDEGEKGGNNVFGEDGVEKEKVDVGGDVAKDNDGDGNVFNDNSNGVRTLVLRTTPQRQEQQRHQQQQLRNGNRRKLEGEVLAITYSQTISYRIQNNAEIDLSDLLQSMVTEPFNNVSKRGRYVESLKSGGGGSFDTLKLATLPSIKEEVVVPPDDGDKKSLNRMVILASVLGGVVVIVLVVILYLMRRRHHMKKKMPVSEYQIELPELTDSGTLNTDPNAGIVSPESVAGFPGQEQSVGTIDDQYQAQNNYPSTVSSSGGTIGSRTFQSRFSGVDSILTPGNNTSGTQSIYTNDDASFEAHLRGATDQPHTRQEQFDVIAPPGKLGVVIDTPNSGAPVIHSIKDDCPIKEKLLVGDHIIAVDDENVMAMTAVKVSRLISQKSANPGRKFTIQRNVISDSTVIS